MNNHQLAFIINCLLWVTGLVLVGYIMTKLVAWFVVKLGIMGLIPATAINFVLWFASFVGLVHLTSAITNGITSKDPDFADPKLWAMAQQYAHRAGVR